MAYGTTYGNILEKPGIRFKQPPPAPQIPGLGLIQHLSRVFQWRGYASSRFSAYSTLYFTCIQEQPTARTCALHMRKARIPSYALGKHARRELLAATRAPLGPRTPAIVCCGG